MRFKISLLSIFCNEVDTYECRFIFRLAEKKKRLSAPLNFDVECVFIFGEMRI